MIQTSTRRKILFIAASLLTNFAFAQSTITGKIFDENNQPLIGAVAELHYAKDSSLAKANATDDKGVYTFANVKAGEYYTKTSMIGFKGESGKVFAFDGTADKELSAVKLISSAQNLQTAEVTASKPLVEVRADKTVFNVENTINSTGTNAYELLQKAPAVVVDNNDNISLKGRGGVLVQIDGKDLRLSAEEVADYLRSIQSTDVESIELISNPSAKYDAAGTAGIINIKLKKNRNYGTNGTLTAGYAYGRYAKYNTGITLNNRSKNFNFFGSYSNSWGTRDFNFFLYREQRPYIFDQSTIFTREYFNHNYKAGVDYTINKKNTIGTMVNGNYSDVTGTTVSRNIINNYLSDETDSILQSDQTVGYIGNNVNVNINHRFSDTLGHELSTDFDYGIFDNDRDSYLPNIYTKPDYVTVLSSAYYRSISPTTITIYTLKSDYSQNFLKGKISAGYKISMVNSDNTFNFYNILGGADYIDPSRSNHFVYKENVSALYLNFQRTLNKFDVQAGVRAENTSSTGDLKTETANVADKTVKRSYLDFFPSAGLTFNANKNHVLALIYSRRIDRPNYQELNPFEYKLDELNYRKGNPFLNPQYSDKVELSHTYKSFLTSTVGYSYTHDFFAQITDTVEGGASYITSENLATEKVTSFSVSLSNQPLKWLNLYYNAGVYNQAYNADFGGGKRVDAAATSFNIYGQNTINFPHDLSLEISGWYNMGGIWGGAYVAGNQGSMDLGLQKKLFKQQATLKLTYTDLFNTAGWKSDNVYANLVIKVHGSWESQQLRASFSWRFGNNQMRSSRQRGTGNEDEQHRVGSGDGNQ